MKSSLSAGVLLGFAAVATLGCGGGEPNPSIVPPIPPEMTSSSPPTDNLGPTVTPPGNVVTAPGVDYGAAAAAAGTGTAPASTPPTEPAAAATERVVAEQGVGIKGRSLDEFEGALVTPAKAFFSVRERVVFEIAVPEALKLYEATNGEGPKSHEEFMAQIVEANQIQLPELPNGHKYVYDPATKQLMVERPKQ